MPLTGGAQIKRNGSRSSIVVSFLRCIRWDVIVLSMYRLRQLRSIYLGNPIEDSDAYRSFALSICLNLFLSGHVLSLDSPSLHLAMEDEPVLNADNLLSRTFPTRVLHNLLPTGTEDLLFRDSATDYVHN